MNVLYRLLPVLPAILFVVIGLQWVVDPSGAASTLGMPLLDGLGRSSQIGDIGAVFLGAGFMILIASVSRNKAWLYAPALMVLLIAVFRILAWLFHSTPLAPQMVLTELLIASLLLFCSRGLTTK